MKRLCDPLPGRSGKASAAGANSKAKAPLLAFTARTLPRSTPRCFGARPRTRRWCLGPAVWLVPMALLTFQEARRQAVVVRILPAREDLCQGRARHAGRAEQRHGGPRAVPGLVHRLAVRRRGEGHVLLALEPTLDLEAAHPGIDELRHVLLGATACSHTFAPGSRAIRSCGDSKYFTESPELQPRNRCRQATQVDQVTILHLIATPKPKPFPSRCQAIGQAARLRALAPVGRAAAPGLRAEALAAVGHAERSVHEDLHLQVAHVRGDAADLRERELSTQHHAVAAQPFSEAERQSSMSLGMSWHVWGMSRCLGSLRRTCPARSGEPMALKWACCGLGQMILVTQKASHSAPAAEVIDICVEACTGICGISSRHASNGVGDPSKARFCVFLHELCMNYHYFDMCSPFLS